MKVEKISPDKFKLTFSCEDLVNFGINFDDLKYDSEEAQELFWNLIEQADIEDDFFEENSQIVVEAMVTKNDGLTMIVTRVWDNKKSPKVKGRKDKIKKHSDISPLIFKFEDFEVLVSACKSVENVYAGVSRLYKLDGEYYLIMDSIYEKVALCTELLLCEYGKKILNSNILQGKIEEYGNLLIDDTAIADISANF